MRKWLISFLMVLMMTEVVNAGVPNFLPIFNPFTSNLQYISDTNQSGQNITADNLFIEGNLTVLGNISANFYHGDGSLLTGISAGGTSVWNSSGSNVFLNDSTGSLGIGVRPSDMLLDVDGNANISGNLYVGTGSSGQILASSSSGGVPAISFRSQSRNGIVSPSSIQIDFIIDGTPVVLIETQGGKGSFKVNEVGFSSNVGFGKNGDVNTGMYFPTTDTVAFSAGGFAMLDLVEAGTDIIMFNKDGNDVDFSIESDDNPNIFFIDGNTNKIGIGTNTPSQILDIAGHLNATGTSSNSTFQGDVKIIGTLYGGSPVKIAGVNISKNVFTLKEDLNRSSRFVLQNLNNGSNASAVIEAINDMGASVFFGIGSSNLILGDIESPNITVLISRSRGDMVFANSFKEKFIWYNNPDDDNDLNNLVEIMKLNEGGLNVTKNLTLGKITFDSTDSLTISNGNPVETTVQIKGSLNISTNLTVNELLILPNVVQLPAQQSTFLVRDDTSGIVGTKFGVRNTVASTDADSGVSYILDVGSGNNMSLDLHSSLDPNNPLTVVSHYNNDILGHVWRISRSNNNAFFKWEVGKDNETFMINQSGRITFGNPDVPFNISGYNPSGQLGHCGMDDNFDWSCSQG